MTIPVTDFLLIHPLLGAVLALAVVVAPASAQGLYRYVDERGRVTYSDVPPDSNAQRLKPGAPNVGSRDAVKQLEIARRERQQLEAEERLAAERRAIAAKPVPPPPPVIIPGRRGGYDSTQPPGQAAGDSSRRY